MAVLDHMILIQLYFYCLHLAIEVHETAIRLSCYVYEYVDWFVMWTESFVQ